MTSDVRFFHELLSGRMSVLHEINCLHVINRRLKTNSFVVFLVLSPVREEEQLKCGSHVRSFNDSVAHCKCTSCHTLPTSPPPPAATHARAYNTYRPHTVASRERDAREWSSTLPRAVSADKLAPRVPVRSDKTRLCSASAFEHNSQPTPYQHHHTTQVNNVDQRSARDVTSIAASHTLPHMRSGILKNAANHASRSYYSSGSGRTQNRVRLNLPHSDDDPDVSSSDTSGSHVTSAASTCSTRNLRKDSLV